jgi:hypothetical protein
MNEEQLYNIVKRNIGKSIGCYRGRRKYGKQALKSWQWFLLENGEWVEVSKRDIQRLIFDALPDRYKTILHVRTMTGWYKMIGYSEKFKEIVDQKS